MSTSVRRLYEVMCLLGRHLNRAQWYNNPTGTLRCTDVDVTSLRCIDVSTTTLRRHVPAWKPWHTYSSSGHNWSGIAWIMRLILIRLLSRWDSSQRVLHELRTLVQALRKDERLKNVLMIIQICFYERLRSLVARAARFGA